VVLGVDAVRERADGPRGAGDAAVDEERRPDRALERAERERRRVCVGGQRLAGDEREGARVPVAWRRTNGLDAIGG
jgi:hypothetical protein